MLINVNISTLAQLWLTLSISCYMLANLHLLSFVFFRCSHVRWHWPKTIYLYYINFLLLFNCTLFCLTEISLKAYFLGWNIVVLLYLYFYYFTASIVFYTGVLMLLYCLFFSLNVCCLYLFIFAIIMLSSSSYFLPVVWGYLLSLDLIKLCNKMTHT